MPLHGEALCESKFRISIVLIRSKEFFYINLQITAICYTSYSCQAELQGPWKACFIHVCKLNSSAGDWPAFSRESKCRGGGGAYRSKTAKNNALVWCVCVNLRHFAQLFESLHTPRVNFVIVGLQVELFLFFLFFLSFFWGGGVGVGIGHAITGKKCQKRPSSMTNSQGCLMPTAFSQIPSPQTSRGFLFN